MADDHPFAPDFLLALLDHALPLVAPLVALRKRSHQPSLFHEDPGGFHRPIPTGFYGYTWEELEGKTGLFPVDTFGGPGAIIRRDVIEAVGMPFFQNMPGARETPMEDLYTFARCRRAGFQPLVDLDVAIGHCHPGVLMPLRTPEGRYVVQFGTQEGPLGWIQPGRDDPTDMREYHAST